MNQLVPIPITLLPPLVTAAGDRAAIRFFEFFAANIRNPHTRRAHSRAAADFLAWREDAGVPQVAAVQPLHVATWIELLARDDLKGPLFRMIGRDKGRQLTRTPLPQANAYAMIRRRAAAAGIETKIGNHTFRATGITAYLKKGGTLENAQAMAAHESTRTTQLYDRTSDAITLDEVERITI